MEPFRPPHPDCPFNPAQLTILEEKVHNLVEHVAATSRELRKTAAGFENRMSAASERLEDKIHAFEVRFESKSAAQQVAETYSSKSVESLWEQLEKLQERTRLLEELRWKLTAAMLFASMVGGAIGSWLKPLLGIAAKGG